MKKCPYCRKSFEDEKVRKCIHCGSYMSRWDRIMHNAITPIVTGIIVGVIITLLGQMIVINEYKHTKKQHYVFLTSLLKNELKLNYNHLQVLDKYTCIERDFLKSNIMDRPTIFPFPRPSFDAWNIIRFDKSNFLNSINPDFLEALNKLYLTLEEIDGRVLEREERMVADDADSTLIHNLASNIHVSIYSVKPQILKVAEYLFPMKDTEKDFGKLLWK